MDFSNTTTKQGIVQDALWWVTADLTSYPYQDIVRSANMGLNEVASIIMECDGRWQWDDTNYTDLPIGTTNIVSGQKDYGIDTSMLEITRVEMLDAGGVLRVLTPIDQRDLTPATGLIIDGLNTNNQYSLNNYPSSTSGTPTAYDVIGNSIFLDATPNYNSTGGLKVYFKRKPYYFTTSNYVSTTNWVDSMQPGFAKHLHRYISFFIAEDYAVAKLLAGNKITSLFNKKAEMKLSIRSFYSRRKKDERPRLKGSMHSTK